MRYSFLLSSRRVPAKESEESFADKIAPPRSRRLLCPANSYVRRSMACTFAVRTLRSKGLAMKSSPPMFIAMTMFMLSDAEERNITGTFDSFRISLHQW